MLITYLYKDKKDLYLKRKYDKINKKIGPSYSDMWLNSEYAGKS